MTVGVIGTGRIGAAVMDRVRGFGCRVLAYDCCPNASAEYVSLDALLAAERRRDAPCAADADTQHLLESSTYRARCETAPSSSTRDAVHCSTPRRCLRPWKAESLGGAALDVLEGEEGVFYTDQRRGTSWEPMLLRLQQLPNVLITPHTAYYTEHALRDTVENTFSTACVSKEGQHGSVEGGCHVRRQLRRASRVGQVCAGGRKTSRPREVRADLCRDHEERCLEAVRRPYADLGRWLLPTGDVVAGPQRPRVACPGRWAYETIHLDVVFPVLHGKLGEDGAMQGLLELVRRPLCRLRCPKLCPVHGQSPSPMPSRAARGLRRPSSGPSRRTSTLIPTSFATRLREAGPFGFVIRREPR